MKNVCIDENRMNEEFLYERASEGHADGKIMTEQVKVYG